MESEACPISPVHSPALLTYTDCTRTLIERCDQGYSIDDAGAMSLWTEDVLRCRRLLIQARKRDSTLSMTLQVAHSHLLCYVDDL